MTDLADLIGDYADNNEPLYQTFVGLAAKAVRETSHYGTDKARCEAYYESYRVSEMRDWADAAGLEIRDYLQARADGLLAEMYRQLSYADWTRLGDRYLPEPVDVWPVGPDDDPDDDGDDTAH